VGENRNGRMEFLFLEHTYRWLKPGGRAGTCGPGRPMIDLRRNTSRPLSGQSDLPPQRTRVDPL
jgi:hypothetical protein